jgi:hypothetical protein
MIKQIMNGFSKFFTKERVIILAAFIILALALYSYTGSKNTIIDRYSNISSDSAPSSSMMSQPSSMMSQPSSMMSQPSSMMSQPSSMMSQPSQQQPAPQMPMSTPPTSNNIQNSVPSMNNQDIASPSDLLPKDDNSQWASLNPVQTSNSIMTPDLLVAGYNIGIDTIGQSLRNPNYQLRSDPIIQKMDIGPWNLSTIEPDIGRVPLEIGSCLK